MAEPEPTLATQARWAEAFAERAGFAYKYYQALEAGRKIDFRISTVQKLAKAFGLEPWELLNTDGPATDPSTLRPHAAFASGSRELTRRCSDRHLAAP